MEKNTLLIDDQVMGFIKRAIAFYIDYNENTIRNKVYENELKDRDQTKLYCKLLQSDLAPPRLHMLSSIFDEMKDLKKCSCGHSEFNIECPIVVCTNCKKEYFFATPECIEYCKSCEGYMVGDCEAKQHINKECLNGNGK